MFASPPVTATPNDADTQHAAKTECQGDTNTNFRVSACHSYPERHLHTAPAKQKPAAAQPRPRAQQLLEKAQCTAPATRKPTAAQRPPRAQQVLQEALCTAPATRKPAAASGAHARSSSEGSVSCACHTKAIRCVARV